MVNINHHGPRNDSMIFFSFFLRFSMENFLDYAETLLIFELEICSFSKWVRMSQQIDWYHHQCTTSAPMCVHSPASKVDKDPYKVKCHIEPSVPPSP